MEGIENERLKGTEGKKKKKNLPYCVSEEKKKKDSKTLREEKMTNFSELIKYTNP